MQLLSFQIHQQQETRMKAQRKAFLGFSLAAAFVLISCASPGGSSVDAAAALEKANAAMGTARVDSLRFAASGTGASYGQAWQPNLQWPKLNYSSFSRLMDYKNAASREEFARSRAEPQGGGGIPLMGEGEQRAIAMLQGPYAWNMLGPAQVASPVATDTRIHDLWTSPHGVLKAAARNNATAMRVNEEGKSYTVLVFSEPSRFTAKAFVSEQGLVEKVESRIPHPVMGESAVVTWYSEYRPQGAAQFPARIRQAQEGVTVLDLQVSEVQLNAPADIVANEMVRTHSERIASEQAAPGVWYIAGASHHSVLIEMNDHAILVESPLYDGRAAAVLAEAKRLLPTKPVRYAVNSHHHFDHAGGMRFAAAEGITIIASAAGVPFFEQALARPNTIRPDALSRSGKSGKVEGVNGKRVLTDGSRNVELHLITDNIHAEGFMMVYLPAERLLIQADAYTPAAPNTPPPAKPNATHLNLIANIEKNGFTVERLLPLHGRIVPLTELYTTAGKKL
jgi:glyoxylase-like metal-dependent hydrolase (beta-lactamase superfamily II)